MSLQVPPQSRGKCPYIPVGRVEAIRSSLSSVTTTNNNNYSEYRLLTTGHSLGPANAVLTAVGLVQYYEQIRNGNVQPFNESSVAPPAPPNHIVSVNFGCPQTGNTAWREFIHNDAVLVHRLSIWRLVLGWDLVPRLPEVLQHVGHTVQLTAGSASFAEKNQTATAAVYYHHIGNETLKVQSVPFGWGAKPFVWVPGALFSHSMTRYWQFLTDWSSVSEPQPWVKDFVHVADDDNNNNNTTPDDRPPNVDDDFYAEPPDDDAFVQNMVMEK